MCEDGSCESVAMLQKHQLQEHVAGADCKGPRCGRGHPAWGATKKPFAFGAKAGGGGIEVNVDGKMEKLFLPGAHVKAKPLACAVCLYDSYQDSIRR